MKTKRILPFFLSLLLLGTIPSNARDNGSDNSGNDPNRIKGPGSAGAGHASTGIVQPSGGFNHGSVNTGGATTRNPMTGSQISPQPSFTRSNNVPTTRNTTLPSFRQPTGNITKPITGVTTVPSTHANSFTGHNTDSKPLFTHPDIRPSTLPGNVTYPSISPSGHPGFNGNKTVTGLTTLPSGPGTGGNKTVTGLTTFPNHTGTGGNKTVTGLTTFPNHTGTGGNKAVTGLTTFPNIPGSGGNKTITGLPNLPNHTGIGGNKAITGLPINPKHPGIGGNIIHNKLPGFVRPGLTPGTVAAIGSIHPGITLPFHRPPGSLAIHPWWGGNTSGLHHSGNFVINNNFSHNWNWSLNRNYWGFRPWWNLPTYYPWYSGHWNYGWNFHHYHWNNWYAPYPSALPGYVVDDDSLGWGLVSWGLGNLVYQIGYLSYVNPYPVEPIIVSPDITIRYDQPMAAIASKAAPADESVAQSAEEQSQAALEQSRAAFKNKDFLAALPLADKAVSLLPADSVLHEYRALVLFALGKYSDCAGVLNSILASNPGWDWTTMIQLYDSEDTYTSQLRKLEIYVENKPNSASARFVLGYHYMICNHLAHAAASFDAVTKLKPSDTVAKQLYDLCRSSSKPGESPDDTAEPTNQPATMPSDAPQVDQLVGTWRTQNGKNGTVVLELGNDGKFVWTFTQGDKKTKLEGEFSMNEKGLLVLASGDTQMVGAATMPNDNQLRFVLAGGPEGDPGLLFTASPR